METTATYKCPECGYTWTVYPPDMKIICPKCGEIGEWTGDWTGDKAPTKAPMAGR